MPQGPLLDVDLTVLRLQRSLLWFFEVTLAEVRRHLGV